MRKSSLRELPMELRTFFYRVAQTRPDLFPSGLVACPVGQRPIEIKDDYFRFQQ